MSAPIDPTTPAALDASVRRALLGLDRADHPGGPHIERAVVGQLEALYRAQITSRQLDLAARWMRSEHDRGYYTIGSAGHESNAAIALATRPTDPALLHYRSGAFYAARAAQVGRDPVPDVLLGMLGPSTSRSPAGGTRSSATATCRSSPRRRRSPPTCRGRSGSRSRSAAAPKLGVELEWPAGAVVVCSFGDASANHSTATGAINAAAHAAHRQLPMPLLFVCEDNGIGISVRTPSGWIEAAYGHRPWLRYERVEGNDPATLVATVRRRSWTGSGPIGDRRSSTCAPFATSATPGPMRKPGTGRPTRCGHRSTSIRSSPRPGCSSPPVTARAPSCLAQYDEIGAEMRRVAVGLFDRPSLTTADDDHGAARTPAAGRGRCRGHSGGRPTDAAASAC